MRQEMYPLKLYLTRLSTAIPFGIGLVLNLWIWIWLLWRIPYQGDQIFLHYNVLFGVDYIGPGWKIFGLPLLGLLILLVNAAVGWLVFKQDRFVAQLLNAIALIAQLFLLIATGLLILLNI